MHICIEGCAHGDLDVIYEEIRGYEEKTQKKVDLLICCGKNVLNLFTVSLNLIYLQETFKQPGILRIWHVWQFQRSI